MLLVQSSMEHICIESLAVASDILILRVYLDILNVHFSPNNEFIW